MNEELKVLHHSETSYLCQGRLFVPKIERGYYAMPWINLKKISNQNLKFLKN